MRSLLADGHTVFIGRTIPSPVIGALIACLIIVSPVTSTTAELDERWIAVDESVENREYAQALELVERIARDASTDADRLRSARVAFEMLHRLRRFPEAQTRGMVWIELAEATGDTDEHITALHMTARICAGQDKVLLAAELMNRALEIGRDAGTDPRSLASIRVDLAMMQVSTAEYAAAGEQLGLAEDALDPTRDRNILLRLKTTRGSLKHYLGLHHQAIEEWSVAEEIARELGNDVRRAGILSRIAQSRIALQDFAEAVILLRRGLDLLPDYANRATYQTSLGVCLFELNRLEEAEAAFEKARLEAIRGGSLQLEARALGKLGQIAWAHGDAELAIDRCTRAEDLCRRSGDVENQIIWMMNTGIVLREDGRPEAAMAVLSDAESLHRARGGGINAANLDSQIGRCLADLGDDDDAEARLLSAIEGAGDNNELVWQTELALARLYRRGSREDEALRSYERALEAIETIRRSLRVEGFKRDFFRDKVGIYAETIDFVIDEIEGPARVVLGFELAERSRARAFLDSLGEARANLEDTLPESLVARETEVMSELSLLQARVRSDGSRPELERTITTLETELEEIQVAARLQNPRFDEISSVKPVSITEVQAVLLPGETVLAYFLAEDRSHLWVVRRDLASHHLLAPRSEIESAARSAYAAMMDPSSSPNLAVLYDLLLAPWLDEYAKPGGSLIIVPSGVLHFIGFEAIPMADAAPTLGDVFTTGYVPSAGSLVELRTRPTVVGKPAILALGGAEYGGDPGVDRGSAIGNLRNLGDLPHSRDEVVRVAALFPSPRSTVLLGSEATESAFKNAVGGQSVVHLATHGWIHPNEPGSSALIMGAGGGEDGLLQFREILRLPLAADLVTLSACQSALGEVVTGEGMVGLARAFFYAGTDSVVATLWNVDDAASAEFMGLFYSALREGLTKAKALRRARVELRADPRYRHPYYWAPYVVLGRGEDTVEFPRERRVGLIVTLAAILFTLAAVVVKAFAGRSG